MLMQLVDEGLVDVEATVRTYLPEFKVADPEVTDGVTLRNLLSHRSGIGGDHILDTGRGDDSLERYVETCAEIGQDHELGATMSYCNTGFSIVGRVIEKVTGKTWDAVLRERLVAPLGLTHTNTLPEEAILFRAAAGHVAPCQGDEEVAPMWVLPRASGPVGLINASAGDVLTFARLHLDEGRAPDGTQLLSAGAAWRCRSRRSSAPTGTRSATAGGSGDPVRLGRRPRYGHDGGTIGSRRGYAWCPRASWRCAWSPTAGGNAAGVRGAVRRVGRRACRHRHARAAAGTGRATGCRPRALRRFV